MKLYHYTCDDGRAGIGDQGVVLPHGGLAGDLAWFTDLAPCAPEALGLTSRLLHCDRTRWRYEVTDSTNVIRWLESPQRRAIGSAGRHALEAHTPGVMPAHWWISAVPVPVRLTEGLVQ